MAEALSWVLAVVAGVVIGHAWLRTVVCKRFGHRWVKRESGWWCSRCTKGFW